jgi:hypothetical protein
MRHVRTCLPPQLLQTVACSIVTAKLDYCNSLLYGISNANIRKLQRVQNSLARLVTGTRKFDHITPVLKKLHWLPISSRITYKIATLTRKILTTGQPSYLSSSLHLRHLPRNLRSCAHRTLQKTDVRKFPSDFSLRGFTNSSAAIWNSLPTDITDNLNSRNIFCERLKTHLCRLAYVD